MQNVKSCFCLPSETFFNKFQDFEKYQAVNQCFTYFRARKEGWRAIVFFQPGTNLEEYDTLPTSKNKSSMSICDSHQWK